MIRRDVREWELGVRQVPEYVMAAVSGKYEKRWAIESRLLTGVFAEFSELDVQCLDAKFYELLVPLIV